MLVVGSIRQGCHNGLMSELKDRLRTDLTAAIKARDEVRSSTLRRLPRGGPPPPLATVADWAAAVAAAGVDYTRIWWDARPHPRLGTLEVRIADQATSVERSAALVALVQALCAAPPEPGADLITAVEPAARELGTCELVTTLRGPVEAERQLEVGRRDGLEAVAADLVRRSRP